MPEHKTAVLFYSKLAKLLAAGFLVFAVLSFLLHITPDLSWDRNPFNEESQVSDDEYWVLLKDRTWLLLAAVSAAVWLVLRAKAKSA